MSEVFDRLAKMVAGDGSRRDALKYLGGFLAGGFLAGITGKARADGDRGRGDRGRGDRGDDGGDDDGGDDDGGDDDDHRNEEINEKCHRFCRKCPRRPRGVQGKCMSHCKRFLHKNRGATLCGACTAANPFTGCVSGAMCCTPAMAAAYCANLQTDVANCGACGTACTKGTTPACCAGACTDLATDINNCGVCGTICTGTTPMCCPTSTGGVACTDVNSDNNNCGACGTVCGSGTTCTNGKCK